MESESDNYEDYIKNQIVLKEQETESSLKELKKQEALTEITRYNLRKAEESGNAESIRLARSKFQQQNKLTELALSNYQSYVNARMMLEAELYGDGDKGTTTKDNSVQLMQERHKQEIEETKKQQETLIQQSGLTEDELIRMKFDNSKELLIQRQSQLAEELEAVKGNALEELKIKTELAKIEADLAKDLTDFIIDEKERQLKRTGTA